MFIPSDDVDGVGLYCCEACDFEMEAPREQPARLVPAPAHWAVHGPATAAAMTTPITSTATVARTLQPL